MLSDGATSWAGWWATSTPCRACTSAASSPPLVALAVAAACVVATALVLPVAALVLAVGLALGGIAVPLLAGRLARLVGRRQAAARGELTAELVELLRGAPELVAYGREDDVLGRVAAADRELVRLGRRDAFVAGLADGASVLMVGLTTVAVLAVAVAAHDAGTLDRVLVATLALLALSSFDAVTPLPAAARELSVDARLGPPRPRADRAGAGRRRPARAATCAASRPSVSRSKA